MVNRFKKYLSEIQQSKQLHYRKLDLEEQMERAYSTARFSRITLTLICPGKFISSSFFTHYFKAQLRVFSGCKV
jgi:hypothetical protein